MLEEYSLVKKAIRFENVPTKIELKTLNFDFLYFSEIKET